MIKQTLFFSTPAVLSLRNSQMVISWRDSEEQLTRPIEDLGCVILEHPMLSVTLPLLAELARNNVAVILCDGRLMPTAMLQPLEANATQGECLRLQLSAGEPVKKQAWRQIVEAKIRNQAALLLRLGLDGDALKPFYLNVRSGDADNREGAAARLYWPRLFGPNFSRDRDGPPPNNLLNYGYAIIRAAAARSLLGSGLLPQLGIFHRSRYNAFPLADDVMEPYRPFVDQAVYRLQGQGQSELDKRAKGELVRLLTCDVRMGTQTSPLQVALTHTTASLAKMLAGQVRRLALPALP